VGLSWHHGPSLENSAAFGIGSRPATRCLVPILRGMCDLKQRCKPCKTMEPFRTAHTARRRRRASMNLFKNKMVGESKPKHDSSGHSIGGRFLSALNVANLSRSLSLSSSLSSGLGRKAKLVRMRDLWAGGKWSPEVLRGERPRFCEPAATAEPLLVAPPVERSRGCWRSVRDTNRMLRVSAADRNRIS
jgi:hypothetical protein